ncbi:MAG: AAA family ATPase [Parcubacteria group bacterium]|jgi:DNA polymerase-3 subunit delta'
MNFIGNAKAVKLSNKAIENRKISQAYLFSGPEGVGKFTLAKIFANSVISERNIFKNDVLSLAGKEEDELDLATIEPEIEEKKGVKKEKDIKIEKIREAQKDLALYPYSGKKKVLIINNAHRMTVSAQNALLKSLEEPNETSIIILVTHNDSKIISTIKSRCQKINFSLADLKEIKKMFDGDIDSNDLVTFSMGRPGLALKMKENKEEFDARKKELEHIKRFPDIGVNERFKLAEKMSSDTMNAIKKFEFWMWIIRLEALRSNNAKGFFSFGTIERIEKSLEIIKSTNANARLVLENLFLEI